MAYPLLFIAWDLRMGKALTDGAQTRPASYSSLRLNLDRKAYTTRRIEKPGSAEPTNVIRPLLPSRPSVPLSLFRGYPRLTALIRGKSRLIAPNRTQKFSGGSRACSRGCTLGTASNRPKLHQLAHACRKRYRSSRNSGEAIPTSCPSVPPFHRF